MLFSFSDNMTDREVYLPGKIRIILNGDAVRRLAH